MRCGPWVLGSLASLPQVCYRGGVAGHHAGLHAGEEVRPGVGAQQQHGRRDALRQQLRRLLLHQLLHALRLPGELRGTKQCREGVCTTGQPEPAISAARGQGHPSEDGITRNVQPH